MSLAEIKQEIQNLSPAERSEVAALIYSLNRETSEYVRELEMRLQRMDAGRKISADDVYAAHERAES